MQNEFSFPSQKSKKRGNGFKDLTGQTFGYLMPFEYIPSLTKGKWKCRCRCGNTTMVESWKLKIGHTKSCGCLNSEITAKRNYVHGLTYTPEYGVWANMIQRATNQRLPQWGDYGGRGITVCERWLHSFKHFIDDMGKRPSPKHMIDRLNNDLGYEPGNCAWRTRSEQMSNRRKPSRHQFTAPG